MVPNSSANNYDDRVLDGRSVVEWWIAAGKHIASTRASGARSGPRRRTKIVFDVINTPAHVLSSKSSKVGRRRSLRPSLASAASHPVPKKCRVPGNCPGAGHATVVHRLHGFICSGVAYLPST